MRLSPHPPLLRYHRLHLLSSAFLQRPSLPSVLHVLPSLPCRNLFVPFSYFLDYNSYRSSIAIVKPYGNFFFWFFFYLFFNIKCFFICFNSCWFCRMFTNLITLNKATVICIYLPHFSSYIKANRMWFFCSPLANLPIILYPYEISGYLPYF